MPTNQNIVFLDNSFIPENKANIPITTHALHYGTACFEGIRAYHSEKQQALFIFRMEDHYKRLKESCKILFIDLPYNINELCDITIKLLKHNFEKTDLYIRPLAYKADRAVGNFNLRTLKDGFLVYTTPLGRHLKEEGTRAKITSWDRVTDNTIPPRGKISGSYVNAALAKTESQAAGFDEAIFLDKNGHVLEGSTENIFIVKDSQIITPPASSDILIGITRNTVIQICKDHLNYNVIERDIDRTELYQADEVFFTGTGAEISPVIEIDARKIGNGNIGPVSEKIKKFYFALVHGDSADYKDWVTKVEK